MLASLLILGACATPSMREPDPSTAQHHLLERMLIASADAWNDGDLEGFLAPYAEDVPLTFVGGSGLVRGKDALRARYQATYFAGGPLPPRLVFDSLEVRGLGPDHALMLGRYRVVERDGGALVSSGRFSLVWGHMEEGWRIIHDHSSEAPPG